MAVAEAAADVVVQELLTNDQEMRKMLYSGTKRAGIEEN
jgi:hypothetical protein